MIPFSPTPHIPGLHLPEHLLLPLFFGILEGVFGIFSSPNLSLSKAFNQSVLLTPWLFSCLWNTWPLNQDFPSYPRLFTRPGRSERFIEKPRGICWKICPLLPLFLTFSFCSISPCSLFSHFPRPLSRLQQKLLHACEERLGILSGKLQRHKNIPSGCSSRSSWSLVELQGCENSIHRCFTELLLIFLCQDLCPLPLRSTFVFPPPPIFFWSFPVGIVLYQVAESLS